MHPSAILDRGGTGIDFGIAKPLRIGHTARVIRLFGFSLMLLAMGSIAGGHWAVLQSVAWAGMIRDYSQQESFVQAVAKTFSGEEPCALCKRVQEGRQQEEKMPPLVKPDKKSELFIAAVRVESPEPSERKAVFPRVVPVDFAARPEAPPSPVPRAASLI